MKENVGLRVRNTYLGVSSGSGTFLVRQSLSFLICKGNGDNNIYFAELFGGFESDRYRQRPMAQCLALSLGPRKC